MDQFGSACSSGMKKLCYFTLWTPNMLIYVLGRMKEKKETSILPASMVIVDFV